jgi:iron(III) transport system ATP-binding protein
VKAISIQDLSSGYGGDPVIRDISFDLEEKELLAILGPSGSGKTTLLKTIAGFLPAQSGLIKLDSQVVSSPQKIVPPEKRNIGLVPQEGSLFPHLDVSANISFGIRRNPKKTQRVAELLEIIDMKEYAHARPQELSGGQQQRVALARALAPTPKLILLDEPFTAMDTSLRAQMRRDIRNILTLTATTAIMVTHDQEEALATADQLAIMQDGRLIAFGTPHELYEKPASKDVASSLGEVNAIPATVESEHSVNTELGTFAARIMGDAVLGQHGIVLVRPEALTIEETDSPNAKITGSVFHGHDSTVTVSTNSGMVLKVRESQQHDRVPGTLCAVKVLREGIFLK